MEEGGPCDRQAPMRFPYTCINMKNIGTIDLEGMEFKAYHGCLEQEKVRGNLFTVDFRGDMDLSAAAASDNLNHTVNYGEIYDIVADEMSIPSELLENVAGRIVKAIEKRFPQFVSFSVRVSKKRPPVEGVAQWSRVTLYHSREQQ